MADRTKQPQTDAIFSTRSCVTLHDSVSMSLRSVRPVPRTLLRMAFALLGVCSTFVIFLGYFPLPVNQLQFYGAVVIATLVFSFFLRKGRSAKWLYILLPVVLLICCVPFWDELRYGMEKAVGFVQSVIDDTQFHLGRPGWKIAWSAQQCLQYAVTLCGVCISFLVCLVTVRRPRFSLAFLLLMGFVEVGLFHGLHTKSMAVFCWLAYMAAMIILTDGNESFGKQKNNKYVFFYVEHTLFAKPSMRFMPTECIAWLVAAVIILLGGVGCMATRNEARMKSAHEIRMQIREKWNTFLEQLPQMLEEQPLGGKQEQSEDSNDQITLADRKNPKFDNETVLSFTMESPYAADTMYLKTSTHSVYTGSQWLPLPDSIYTVWSNLFNQMYSNRSMPQAPLRAADNPLAAITYPNSSNSAEKPLPYRALWQQSVLYQHDFDMQLILPEQQLYEFDPLYLFEDQTLFYNVSYPTATSMDYYHSGLGSPLISDAWQQYDSFVRVNYLQVPYSNAMETIREDANEVLNGSYSNTAEALYAIRTYLHSKAVYSLTPEIVDEDTDFASHFLLEGGEGYCVHFATAGVLLCRMMQIPARYATGYVVFREDFDDALQQVTGNTYYYAVDVPDSRAHAWVEVYLPGYGWMPYEFTAGYTDADSFQAVSPQSTSADTSITTTTTTTTTTSARGSSVATDNSGNTTVSAVTSQTTAGSSVSGGGWGTVLKGLLICIAVIASLLLLVVLYILIHRMIYSKRERCMTDSDSNRAASASYAQLLRVLSAEGISRRPQQSHEDFALMAEEMCKAIPTGAMQRAVETQLAVTFSRSGVTKEEAAEQAAFVRELIHKLYAQASPQKRFVLRWLRHWII